MRSHGLRAEAQWMLKNQACIPRDQYTCSFVDFIPLRRIPIYILAEANLGLLGLGVSDPLPSWGNLLRPLESAFAPSAGAWAPLVLMVIVVTCLYLIRPSEALVR